MNLRITRFACLILVGIGIRAMKGGLEGLRSEVVGPHGYLVAVNAVTLSICWYIVLSFLSNGPFNL